KNLIFLSAGGLKAFLLAHDQKILSVDAVQKKFPAALKIMLTPRQDEFLLENASSTAYSMANDGLVTGLVLPDASGTLPSSLLPLKYDSAAGLAVGQTALPAGSVKFLENLKQRLPALGRSPLAYFELADLSLPDLQAVMQNGLILKFDLNADLEQTLSRLTLLLAQFSDSDLKKIYYVDMRFAERGYVCNKGQPCTSSEAVPQTASSTAPAGLTP
ncbi:MAG TPA: hypothetical protein VHA30_02670, partial [Patescibacteria group bacterium]|nr:hypothetical protein [Patescibacteria group bacterium]